MTQQTNKMSKQKKKQNKGTTAMGKAIRALTTAAGAMAGHVVGQPINGAAIGFNTGAKISKYLGQGDYMVSSNSLLSGGQPSSNIPMMHKTSQSITVRHKEYLGPLLGSINFNARKLFVLNPGMDDTFPWLAGIARNFQEYRFKGIVYHYVPTSGTALTGTNPALGSVMFQTSYRSNDTQPTSKMELLNEYCSSEARPCDQLAHPIECNPVENPLGVQYVRTDSIPTGDSPLMYDLGATTVAVEGQLANDTILGDIWITYEVELKKPILRSNVTTIPYTGIQLVSTAITGSNLFPAQYTKQLPNGWVGQDNIGLTVYTNTVAFPDNLSGVYNLEIVLVGTTGWNSMGDPTIAYTNCAASTDYYPNFYETAGTYTSNVTHITISTNINFTNQKFAYIIVSNTTLTATTTPLGVIVALRKIA